MKYFYSGSTPKNIESLPEFGEFDFILISKEKSSFYPCSEEELDFILKNKNYTIIFENGFGTILAKK